jgi:protein-tyrosine phosphatase
MNTHTLLFLCTGNYFRSRFAEIYFNHHAERKNLAWSADSRGIAVELGHGNVGPISRHTLRGLERRRIGPAGSMRFPVQLSEDDLFRARHIVAVKAAEHRPLLARKFPAWVERVEYWDVDDVDCVLPDEALAVLERELDGLLRRLEAAGAPDSRQGFVSINTGK